MCFIDVKGVFVCLVIGEYALCIGEGGYNIMLVSKIHLPAGISSAASLGRGFCRGGRSLPIVATDRS